MRIKDQLKTIFNHYGEKAQELQFLEEIEEVIEATRDYMMSESAENLDHLLEEIADYLNMAEQFAIHLKVSREDIYLFEQLPGIIREKIRFLYIRHGVEVIKYRHAKIDRTLKRIEEER